VRDKLIGTLLVPGGLLPVAYLSVAATGEESCRTGPKGVEQCIGGVSTVQRIALIALWVVLLVAPIVTATHLARQLGKEPASP
jgi:hypothetical protein